MRFVKYEVTRELCRSCGACVRACPKRAIALDEMGVAVIDSARCDACGACAQACKLCGIVKKRGLFR